MALQHICQFCELRYPYVSNGYLHLSCNVIRSRRFLHRPPIQGRFYFWIGDSDYVVMTGISPRLSLYKSPMSSYQRASIFPFSMMIVQYLASMHVVPPSLHFPPVANLICLCMRLVLYSPSGCSMSVSRFSFASIHTCLISLSSIL